MTLDKMKLMMAMDEHDILFIVYKYLYTVRLALLGLTKGPFHHQFLIFASYFLLIFLKCSYYLSPADSDSEQVKFRGTTLCPSSFQKMMIMMS